MILTGFDLGAALDRLDSDLAEAHSAARRLLGANGSACGNSVGPRRFVRREAWLEDLENGLRERYGAAFADPAWHGPTSFQRIVWQDGETVEAFARPGAVQALLQRRESGAEPYLGRRGVTLSGALITGLARNRPSYLLSACPNWRCRPALIPCDHLEDMATGDRLQHEPHVVRASGLEAARLAALGVQECVGEKPAAQICETGAAFHRALRTACAASLLSALGRICTRPVAARIMESSDNPSVTLPRMNGQCLEVMAHYDDLVAACDGDHARALGYGLVSHVLDAKHLIAVLAVASGKQTDRAAPAVHGLLRAAANGALGSEADALMRARLQQCLFLMWQDRDELGLSEAALEGALALPAEKVI